MSEVTNIDPKVFSLNPSNRSFLAKAVFIWSNCLNLCRKLSPGAFDRNQPVIEQGLILMNIQFFLKRPLMFYPFEPQCRHVDLHSKHTVTHVYNEFQRTWKTLRNKGSSLYYYYKYLVIFFRIRCTVHQIVSM